jgi:hypothetical protein
MKKTYLLLVSSILGAAFLCGCAENEIVGEKQEIKAGEAKSAPVAMVTDIPGVPNPFERTRPTAVNKEKQPKVEDTQPTPAPQPPPETLPQPTPPPTAPTSIPPEAQPAVAAFNSFINAVSNRNGEMAWELLSTAARGQFNCLYTQLQSQSAKDPRIAQELATVKSGKDLWVQSIVRSAPDTAALSQAQVVGAEMRGNQAVLVLRNGQKAIMINEGGTWKVNPGL